MLCDVGIRSKNLIFEVLSRSLVDTKFCQLKFLNGHFWYHIKIFKKLSVEKHRGQNFLLFTLNFGEEQIVNPHFFDELL